MKTHEIQASAGLIIKPTTFRSYNYFIGKVLGWMVLRLETLLYGASHDGYEFCKNATFFRTTFLSNNGCFITIIFTNL